MSAAPTTKYETKLPPAVQRQLNELAALAGAQEQPAPPATPDGNTAPAAAPVATAAAAPGATAATPAPVAAEAAPVPVAPAAPDEQPKAAAEAPLPGPTAEDLAKAEQRFRVIQGKYQSEVPRLNQQLRQALATIADLEKRVVVPAPGTAPAPAPVAAPAAPAPERPVTKADITEADVRAEVSQADIDEYGMDFWRSVLAREKEMERRLRRELASVPVAAAEQPKLEMMEYQLERVRLTQFENDLSAFHPDWREVNGTEAWIAYLQEVNTITGQTYQQHVSAACDAYDAFRVSEIINAFKARNNGGARHAPAAAAMTTPPTSNNGKRTVILPSVEAQVTPGGHGGATVAAQKPVYTLEQYKRRENEVAQLITRNPAEAERQLVELHAAITEGRVQGLV